MYLKLIFKQTINNKQMYSPRLYKYRDSYVRYIPSVHAMVRDSLHTHDVSAPRAESLAGAEGSDNIL